jgi:hypothetical protein
MIAPRLAALLLFIFVLAGCAGATPGAAPTSPPVVETATRLPSATPRPTITPRPTLTDLPSATPTITQTPTATPDPVLADVRLLGVSWQSDYNLLLSIQFPGPVDPASYRVVVEDKEYACQGLAQQPTRLFCIGQGMRVYSRARVRIFPAGSDQAGFDGQISIPYFTN